MIFMRGVEMASLAKHDVVKPVERELMDEDVKHREGKEMEEDRQESAFMR
jgi:hypothetical protein